MRCLVVADLHYSLPQFDWLPAAAPEFDVVIFAGDALDIGSFVMHQIGQIGVGNVEPLRQQARDR